MSSRYRMEFLPGMLLVAILSFVPGQISFAQSPNSLSAIPAPEDPGANGTAMKGEQIARHWTEVAPDLWSSQVTLPGTSIFRSELLAFRSTLSQFSLAILKASEIGAQRSTVRYLADSGGAVVAVNGSFFDEFGRALGLLVSRGIIAQPLQKRGNTLTTIFAISAGKPQIISRSDFKVDGVTAALQAGPRLLRGGARVPGLEERDTVTRRSGLCIDRSGALVMYTTSSRLRGVSLSQLQEALVTVYDCVDAINLDGGGSSQLYFRGFPERGIEPISLEGQDLIPNAIGLVGNK